jgi:hypothetical protein
MLVFMSLLAMLETFQCFSVSYSNFVLLFGQFMLQRRWASTSTHLKQKNCNTQLESTLYKSLSHTDQCSQAVTVSTNRCLVAASNHFLCVPQLSTCLSYQLQTATANNEWAPAVIWLTHSQTNSSLTHQPSTHSPLTSAPNLCCL